MLNENLTQKELEEKVREDFEKANEKRNKYIISFKHEDTYIIANAGAGFEKIQHAILYFGERKVQIKDGQLVSGNDFAFIVRPAKLISGSFYKNENESYFRAKKEEEKSTNLPVLALVETKTKTFLLSFDVQTRIISSFCVSSDTSDGNTHSALYNSLSYFLEMKEREPNE